MAELIQTELEDAVIANQEFSAVAAAGPYNGIAVGIFINSVTPNKTSVLADFTEPTYAGYARITPTWGGAVRGEDGFIRQRSSLVTFQETGVITAETINGMFLVDGVVLVAALLFDDPVQLVDALSVCQFIVDVIVGRDNVGGVEMIS